MEKHKKNNNSLINHVQAAEMAPSKSSNYNIGFEKNL